MNSLIIFWLGVPVIGLVLAIMGKFVIRKRILTIIGLALLGGFIVYNFLIIVAFGLSDM
ncbi:MAG: hypothetical protein AAB408_05290 [Patescibacteria group bacterium]